MLAKANCKIKTTGRRLSAEPAFGYGLFGVAVAGRCRSFLTEWVRGVSKNGVSEG
jgi:hypothetical protein